MLITVHTVNKTQFSTLLDFDISVQFDWGVERIPFTYSLEDSAPLTLELRQWIQDNQDYPVGAYVPPTLGPYDYPLRPDQFYAMLDIANLTETVEAAIEAIPDETQRKIAKAKLKYTPIFYRDHPLFDLLKAGVGMTDAQIDTLWMQAKDI